MPENLFGLPTHILLLHLVVVVLPMAALATVAVALSARFRHRWGLLVVGCTFVVSLFVPLTSQAGESLAARLPDAPQIARHADIGQQLVIWTAVFGVCLAGLVLVDLARRVSSPVDVLTPAESWASRFATPGWRESPPGWADGAFRVLQILALLAAFGVVVMVIRAGHSGAQAVWTNYPHLRSA